MKLAALTNRRVEPNYGREGLRDEFPPLVTLPRSPEGGEPANEQTTTPQRMGTGDSKLAPSVRQAAARKPTVCAVPGQAYSENFSTRSPRLADPSSTDGGHPVPQSFAFKDATRLQQSLLAPVEKICLRWLAYRMPDWVTPDHLTGLGFVAQLAGGVCYALVHTWRPGLLLVNLCIALNWFGDSLDGTLARTRNRLRPRYGFYVDHITDTFGAIFLIGGLAYSGLASERVAWGMLIGFLLLSVNTYLATYTTGAFRLSFWKFSPTELRILLMMGNSYAFQHPRVHVFGVEYLLFDVGGVIGTAGMLVIVAGSAIRNTVTLYKAERL
ncbi:MAG TPA: hypothetical protein VJX67_17150 [Blastocatellia bacterium]|nr:hypothetical protein [Blastocatellia bacterium]